MLQHGFATTPIEMQMMWLLKFQAPIDDIDLIFEAITDIEPLAHGKTNMNGYRHAPGQEYYRPREGTPTGAEEDIRKRPGVDEMSLFLPRDEDKLRRVIEAIYEVHCYYEPVIIVQEVLRSRGKGLDDNKNPHRWWNKTGDWKTANG
ncbi:hypothetical protein C1J03_22020 [Sulfitobacter sp. SK012]|nr:hypothetical protein C1J03_22020 [Sulfitobacter sp. SK012]